MLNDVAILGVYLPALLVAVVAAVPPFLACRWLLGRAGLLSRVAYLPLFELSVFVMVLGAVAYL